MNDQDQISLNHFLCSPQRFEARLFRREKNEITNPYDSDEVRMYRLPSSPGLPNQTDPQGGEYREYWVSLSNLEGMSPFQYKSHHNIYLTKFVLYKKLLDHVRNTLDSESYELGGGRFRLRINFVLNEKGPGIQTVWLEPYFLRHGDNRGFGFLVDFKFLLNEDADFTKEVQRLSLSLDNQYQENTNFYQDRYEMLQRFINIYYNKIFPYPLDTVFGK